jgi:hypothetical protein
VLSKDIQYLKLSAIIVKMIRGKASGIVTAPNGEHLMKKDHEFTNKFANGFSHTIIPGYRIREFVAKKSSYQQNRILKCPIILCVRFD